MVIIVFFVNGGLTLVFHIYPNVGGELDYARSGCRLCIQCLFAEVVYSCSYFADLVFYESTLGSIRSHSPCPFRHAMFMFSMHNGHFDASAHMMFAFQHISF